MIYANTISKAIINLLKFYNGTGIEFISEKHYANLLALLKLDSPHEIEKPNITKNVSIDKDYEKTISKDGDKDNRINTVNINIPNTLDKKGKLENLQDIVLKKADIFYKEIANNMVFGEGNINAKCMLIGEAPGADEDITGKPFVGRSGAILNNILEEYDFYRYDRKQKTNEAIFNKIDASSNDSNLYVSNIVPWRPPNNRQPTIEELNLMRDFVYEHIKIISPKVILLCGAVPTKTILKTDSGITKIRGNVYVCNPDFAIKKEFICNDNGKDLILSGDLDKDQFLNEIITYERDCDDYLVIPTLHPAYIIRVPSKKTYLERDISLMKKIIGSD